MAVLLLSDADLACIIKMSRSWIRKERMRRRAGLPHVLNIDPIMLGACPRYSALEVESWIEKKASQRSSSRSSI